MELNINDYISSNFVCYLGCVFERVENCIILINWYGG